MQFAEFSKIILLVQSKLKSDAKTVEKNRKQFAQLSLFFWHKIGEKPGRHPLHQESIDKSLPQTFFVSK